MRHVDGVAGAAGLVPALVLALLLAGCGGGGGGSSDAAGASAAPGGTKTILADPVSGGRVTVATEAPGAACPAGGQRVTLWTDRNGNGALDEGESGGTGVVCNGAGGAAGAVSRVRAAVEPAGANCPAGGVKLTAGLDADGNGTLADTEVTSTSYACNGAPASSHAAPLLALTTEPAGAACANGGSRIAIGLDTNGNGTLDAGEATGSSVICHGAPGANASAAPASLVALVDEPAGANCAAGGTAIRGGRDADGDGVLGAGEVTATRYVCNGAAGATGATGPSGATSLVVGAGEPAGANCPEGGTRLAIGVDADGSGTLEAGEVNATRFVCNGASSGAGFTSRTTISAEPAGVNCTAGGSRIASGLDANANGVLDAGEVVLTSYACHGAAGAAGADGRDGAVSRVVVSPEAPGAHCAAGGSRIDAGLDADDNGTLDASEITSTGYACNGAAGAAGSNGSNGAVSRVNLVPDSALCGGAGGTRVQVGLDSNGNGVLDAAEVTSSASICNGQNATSLFWSSYTTGPVNARVNESIVARASDTPLVINLPDSTFVGDTLRVTGGGRGGGGGWVIAQSGGQRIDTSRMGAAALQKDGLGVSWDFPHLLELANNPTPSLGSGRDLAVSRDGKVVLFAAIGHGARLSTDGGVTSVIPPIGNAGVASAAAAMTPDGGTMALDVQLIGSEGLYLSTDRGRTWARRLAVPAGAARISAVALSADGRRVLAALEPTLGGLLRMQQSLDYGHTWSEVGPNDRITTVRSSADGMTLVAVSNWNNRLHISRDGGVTWSTRSGQAWFDAAVSADGQTIGATIFGGTVQISTDGGATFSSKTPVGNWAGISVSEDGSRWVAQNVADVAGFTRGVYLSTDRGNTWSRRASLTAAGNIGSLLSNGNYRCAMAGDGSRVFVQIASSDDSLMRSTVEGYVTSSTTGSAGSLSGGPYNAVELQYLGSGTWFVVSHTGELFVQ